MGYGLYGEMTDEQLEAEIREYHAAIRAFGKPGRDVVEVAGEGRRVRFREYTGANIGEAKTELRNLLAEARRRGLPIGDGSAGAIAVEIG